MIRYSAEKSNDGVAKVIYTSKDRKSRKTFKFLTFRLCFGLACQSTSGQVFGVSSLVKMICTVVTITSALGRSLHSRPSPVSATWRLLPSEVISPSSITHQRWMSCFLFSSTTNCSDFVSEKKKENVPI